MLESHYSTCYRNSAKTAADVSLTETPAAPPDWSPDRPRATARQRATDVLTDRRRAG
ncbi:hypothetical protein BURMUCF1_3445 [Burkholderia multivorans ATCC BAA-247]|uniref:Uncharacterized protein n=1 Tax=Burkholderia multivorans CGD2 TaxID=513052 RepID=B9BZJ3_9BURK|nr:hypothetical protein BURMUCGD2_0078 [Burkholderia multivorans CGD2]EEE10361.1 hypothetical protein BURMUCGD2M_0078 [Burkholderia multivorans CGD2M]EJO62439.1 hypothetical protein BURMUCF1_3445 [Burkholderia multivorans ATCC BAA-247]